MLNVLKHGPCHDGKFTQVKFWHGCVYWLNWSYEENDDSLDDGKSQEYWPF